MPMMWSKQICDFRPRGLKMLRLNHGSHGPQADDQYLQTLASNSVKLRLKLLIRLTV